MAGERELVRDGGALGGETVTDGAGRSLGVGRIGVLEGGLGDLLDLLLEGVDLQGLGVETGFGGG